MALIVLSREVLPTEKTFCNLVLAATYAKLRTSISKHAYKSGDKFNTFSEIFVGDYSADDETSQSFSISVLSERWSKTQFDQGLMKVEFDSYFYYSLAGTDNTPPHLCYDFSLAYLRQCPKHLISIYDSVFCLADLELIEKEGGYYDEWMIKGKRK